MLQKGDRPRNTRTTRKGRKQIEQEETEVTEDTGFDAATLLNQASLILSGLRSIILLPTDLAIFAAYIPSFRTYESFASLVGALSCRALCVNLGAPRPAATRNLGRGGVSTRPWEREINLGTLSVSSVTSCSFFLSCCSCVSWFNSARLRGQKPPLKFSNSS